MKKLCVQLVKKISLPELSEDLDQFTGITVCPHPKAHNFIEEFILSYLLLIKLDSFMLSLYAVVRLVILPRAYSTCSCLCLIKGILDV